MHSKSTYIRNKFLNMLKKNINLQHFNTFGIRAVSKFYARFSSEEQLTSLLKEAEDYPLLILGGGSNVLFLGDFDGVTLHNKIEGIELIKEDDNEVFLKVGAGVEWHHFVLYAIDNNWGGIENLSLIPGSVGASPMQNIGAYGVETKDVFVELEALEIATKEMKRFSQSDCQFGYRESIFKNSHKDKYVITSVTYRLRKKPVVNTDYGAIKSQLLEQNITQPSIKDISDAVIAIRQSKLPDPKKIGNAGSFFKNPIVEKSKYEDVKEIYPDMPSYPIDENHVKIPAAWLIDQAGWKGKTLGEYGVHKNQALVLVNYSTAKGEDIFQLSTTIINDIYDRYTIMLEREVNIIG